MTETISLSGSNIGKIIQTQLGRRNLTTYQKGELALRFELLIRAQTRERLVTSTGGHDPRPVKNSAQAGNGVEGKSRDQLGKLAGIMSSKSGRFAATAADLHTCRLATIDTVKYSAQIPSAFR